MDNNQIIVEKELELGKDYIDIKKRFEKYLIQNKLDDYLGKPATWNNDDTIFMFDGNKLLYKTEQILPLKTIKRIPVMLLFSNPHPASVSHGLFLSEPHSRIFWNRLFDCKIIFPEKANYDARKLEQPDEIEILRSIMLSGKYESEFLLYFYCYWGLPTRDAAELKSIFSNHDSLWNEICKKSNHAFKKTLIDYKINNVVVFADAPFKQITDVSDTSYKYKKWLGEVKKYLDNPYNNERAFLANLQWPFKYDKSVKVYRSLRTLDKNHKNTNTGKRYFTELLDIIFQNILSKTG